jgi:hypothetical protein
LRRKLAKARRRTDDDGEDVFRRTNCNQWVRTPIMNDDDQPQVISPELWAERTKPGARFVGDIALSIDLSPGTDIVYLAASGVSSTGHMMVEVIHSMPFTGFPADIEAVIDQAIQRFAPVAVAWDNGGPTRIIAPSIERAVEERAKLVKLNGGEWSAACESFLHGITVGSICHLGQDWLTFAVEGAVMKHRGQARVWDRLTAMSDIAPLCAATAAHRAIEAHIVPADDEEFYVY